MGRICELCMRDKDEGHVCQKCRLEFTPLACCSDYDLHQTIFCTDCDQYNFPCVKCAKYTFGYKLGTGNGPNEILPMRLDEMLTVVIAYYENKTKSHVSNINSSNDHVKEVNEPVVNEVTNESIINHSNEPNTNEINTNESINDPVKDIEDELIEHETQENIQAETEIVKKKKGYYSRYCSIQ